jgi:hypothetical protein
MGRRTTHLRFDPLELPTGGGSNETIVPEHEYGISTWNQFGGPLFAIGSTRTRVAPRSR